MGTLLGHDERQLVVGRRQIAFPHLFLDSYVNTSAFQAFIGV
jgi:hypothetical protein